ncbi:hypothetical protein AB1Y20_022216 [Prymnesium parvum]|uniref:Importin N-terminal domain-containing protein n=1 Tax=Prymnesium parvum TaxID=97485 RepID=A0AB34JI67_PRYPA
MQAPSSELQTFEEHCQTLYTASDPNRRAAAEAALMQLSTSPAYIPQCQYVLDHSALSQAQVIASNALQKLVLQFWNQLSHAQRLDHRNHALNFLANKPRCEHYVAVSLGQLVANITKLGWLDSVEHQQIVSEVGKFLSAGGEHVGLGLQLLEQLVNVMNSASNMRSLTQHRKVAGHFRDTCLFDIMQQALLVQSPNAENATILEKSLNLVLACLSYDFIGTSLDEAAEELGTIQAPTSWRPLMEDATTQQLLFDVYHATSPPHSSLALEVLVLLASIRRSLFSSDEQRNLFLAGFVRGSLHILQSQKGLSEHSNYHELCRLLARLKGSFQLSELVQVGEYAEWIASVAAFTVDSFKHWQWAANSLFYLLSLWSRLVASMPYLKGTTPSLLEKYVPQVITAFIQSRMELVRALLQPSSDQADLENPFDDEEQLMEQLETLPALCRFQLQQVLTYALSLFEPSARAYQDALALPLAQQMEPSVQLRLAQSEGELAWLVYIISMVLGSHGAPNANSENVQLVDGDLTAAVLQLLTLSDSAQCVHSRRDHMSHQHLNLAIIFFMQQFRKVYVGDQATSSSKVYSRLDERLALRDHVAVLGVLVNKILTDLQLRSSNLGTITKALQLFADLAGGYCSGKLMLKLEAVHRMLANHATADLPFLEEAANTRLRTLFFSTLCKLLFLDETHVSFKAFVAPLTSLLTSLSAETMPSPQMRAALTGALRDLRGIVSACSNRRTYSLFFDWIYPDFTPLFQRAASMYYDSPDLTTPLLKLYAELVHNKTQRLTFDSSSPNGILLFRDMSAVLVAYGSRILEYKVPVGGDAYACKYKGISICLTVFARALSGNYVNFGVFALYGDRALADCLEVMIKLCLSMRLDEIFVYPKVTRAYFMLIELLMRNHATMVVELDTSVLRHICLSLQEGLKSYEVAISSQCAAALEHLAAFHFQQLTEERERPAKRHLQAHLHNEPGLFSGQLEVLLHMVVFEDCANQWSLSRPLLALILTNSDFFARWKEEALAHQAGNHERQQKLALAFEKLMTDVQPNLDAKNRDRFTQNLTLFRHEMKNIF